MRDLDKAIADYSKVIELGPNNVEALTQRGLWYVLKGEFDKAITDFTRLIEINPADAQAYYYRGRAFADTGNKEKAIIDLETCIRLDASFAKDAEPVIKGLQSPAGQ